MAFKSSINSGLPNIPEPPDPAFFAEFAKLYNAIRNIQIAIDTYTGALAQESQYFSQVTPTDTIRSQNMVRLYVKLGVAIAYGQTVHLYNNAGVLTAELATAVSSAKPCHGWCSTVGGGIAGGYAEVMLGGLCTAISGLTPGATYYQANTAGNIANTAGTFSQKIGFALGASLLYMNPDLV